MKRLATFVVALYVFLGISAQENNSFLFGYLSYEQALRSMSDYALVQKQIATLQEQYQAETKRVEAEFNRKYEEFLDGQREFPKTILQKRQTELQELMEKNIAFKEESRKQLAATEKESIAPLKVRLSDTIAKVAKERGLALVINTDAEACPYIDPTLGEDLNQIIQDALK